MAGKKSGKKKTSGEAKGTAQSTKQDSSELRRFSQLKHNEMPSPKRQLWRGLLTKDKRVVLGRGIISLLLSCLQSKGVRNGRKCSNRRST